MTDNSKGMRSCACARIAARHSDKAHHAESTMDG